MASELHRQITLMEQLDAVDRSALGTREAHTVVQEALRCLATSTDARDVTIALVSQDDHNALDAVQLQAATGRQSTARLLLGRVNGRSCSPIRATWC
ncbi:MAG: hypothetical protein HC937_03005 [Aquincola sp.]|nr:hypothetical protein [Aquincola sp.]